MRSKFSNKFCLLLPIMVLLTSCSVRKKATNDTKDNFKLVLEENFKGKDFDSNVWSDYPAGIGKSPWNRFVTTDKSLTEVKEGNLFLRARWNNETNLPETGAIQTKDKFSFKYGKIEVRAKFTKSGQGAWPAIWLMPQNQVFEDWPSCGEIDIMERLNTDAFVHQVVHQTNDASKNVSVENKPEIKVSEYNTYSVIKLPNKIEYYVNDKLSFVHQPNGEFEARWPFETDFYIILNYACADAGKSGVKFWPGFVTNTEDLPYEMAVDYVKVWKLNE